MVATAGQAIPVVGVPLLTLFAMQVSVDGHSFRSLQLIDELMRGFPIALGIPPERLERRGEAGGR